MKFKPLFCGWHFSLVFPSRLPFFSSLSSFLTKLESQSFAEMWPQISHFRCDTTSPRWLSRNSEGVMSRSVCIFYLWFSGDVWKMTGKRETKQMRNAKVGIAQFRVRPDIKFTIDWLYIVGTGIIAPFDMETKSDIWGTKSLKFIFRIFHIACFRTHEAVIMFTAQFRKINFHTR